MVNLSGFHAYLYWGFQLLKGSLRDAFKSRSALKGELPVVTAQYPRYTYTFIFTVPFTLQFADIPTFRDCVLCAQFIIFLFWFLSRI
jgi:hypothetical protein